MNRERTERSTRPLTRLWQAGREDSAGDNETCSRPPTDLRGSPAVRASPPTGRRCRGAMTAGATGGLECSRRWGRVANTAYNKTEGPPAWGLSVLRQPKLPQRERPRMWIEMDHPLLASGHRVQRWSKVERQHFSGAVFLRFPTDQRETCTHWTLCLHRRADYGTDEDQLS